MTDCIEQTHRVRIFICKPSALKVEKKEYWKLLKTDIPNPVCCCNCATEVAVWSYCTAEDVHLTIQYKLLKSHQTEKATRELYPLIKLNISSKYPSLKAKQRVKNYKILN